MDIPEEILRWYQSWDGMQQVLDQRGNPLPDSAKRIAARAIELLRQWFSDSWLQRGGQLGDLRYSPHNKTLLNALNLATVAALFACARNLRGADELLRDAMEIQDSRWRHTLTILELAWLLGDGTNGASVDLEPTLDGGHKSDLAISLEDQRTYIEVTTKGETARERNAEMQFQVVSTINFSLECRYAVDIQVQIKQEPPKLPADFSHWCDQYAVGAEALAEAVRSDGTPRSNECAGVLLSICPSGHRQPDRSSESARVPIETDVAKIICRGIEEKAQQCCSAPSLIIWLQDTGDNLRCTPWSQGSLANKNDSLRELLAPISDRHPNLAAVVITTMSPTLIVGNPMVTGSWGWSSVWTMATAGYVESHAVQFLSSPVLDQLGKMTRATHSRGISQLLVAAGFDAHDVNALIQAIHDERTKNQMPSVP